jgi:TolA-binding protein
MESDASQSAFLYKASAWAAAHSKQLVLFVVVVLAIVAGVVGLVWYQNYQEAKGNSALSAVTATAEGEPTAEALAQVGVDHAGTSAGGRAVLLAGSAFFSRGQYTEAKAQFEKYLREYRDTTFAPQASFGLAASTEALGDAEAAMKTYTDLSTRYGSDFVGMQAKLAMGRLHESQNRLEQARAAYEEVARSGVGGSLASQAATAYQTLIANHPELVQPTPAQEEAPSAPLQAPALDEVPADAPAMNLTNP